MHPKRILTLIIAIFLVSTAFAAEPKTLLISDFENDADLKAWDISGTSKLVSEGVTHGAKALEIKGSLSAVKPLQDLSAYDALMLDVLNPGDAPVGAEVMIGDQAWQQKTTYWNRHNGLATFAPGKTTWTIPVHGLYRGEAGSRNNDIKTDIDPASIVRLAFTFNGKVIVDNLRLVSAQAPKGVWAFDMGPASQAVMLAWTPVSNKTVYNPKAGYGWNTSLSDSIARDTTFGPAMLRDFVECGGSSFRVDVPAGKYNVTVFYENSGYWDGEQAQQKTRKIEVGNQTVWQDARPDGAANYLYRFENVEPIGVDIWDTYMAPELAKPAAFQTSAGNDGLTMTFSADAPWGSRVAGIVINNADNGEAATWVKDQLAALATEFRGMAVPLDKPAGKFDAGDWAKVGLAAWALKIEDTVKPNHVPAKLVAPDQLQLSRMAVQGEYETFCLAVRPIKDLGACTLRLEGGAPGIEATTGVVWYGMSRGFGTASYHIVPQTLRQQSSVNLPAEITREIVVTCKVTDKATAGDAKYTLIIEDASRGTILRVPLTLSIHAVKLDRDTDYTFGFFGMNPPSCLTPAQQTAAMEDTLRQLKEHGINGLSGGANFYFKGFKDGQPQIDFKEMDNFVELARKAGFTKGIDGYGAAHLVGVNDGYEIGATGKRIAQEAGTSYEEAMLKIWKVVDQHARAANWPVIYYAICDETRVREVAEKELEFMQVMAKVSKAYPKTLRTSGCYSVNFDKQVTNKNDMLYWHQQFFKALDISALGGHDQSVMDEAQKLGKEVQIYNQGIDRNSFGIYQWSEFRKGVKARWQWHLTIMHGYQFFDLDGREPDSQLICYGRNGIIPTIALERCRQGAQDFYLCQTLWNLVQKGAGDAQTRTRVQALLEDAIGKIKIGQPRSIAGFDPDDFNAKVVAAIESLTPSAK